MFDEHKEQLDNLLEWYVEVKSSLLTAESLESKLYIQPYNELRYSYDHFLRALLWEIEKDNLSVIDTNVDEKKQKLNKDVSEALASAIKHFQRAYSDICEWYYLTVKDYVLTTLNKYTVDQINNAIPDYYSKYKPKLARINKDLTAYKESKTAEQNNLVENNPDILMFSEQMKELTEIYNAVNDSELSLSELKRKTRISNIVFRIALPTTTAIISGIIVYFLTH